MRRKQRLNTTENALLRKVSDELDILYNHFSANDMILEDNDSTASQMMSVAMQAIDKVLNEY